MLMCAHSDCIKAPCRNQTQKSIMRTLFQLENFNTSFRYEHRSIRKCFKRDFQIFSLGETPETTTLSPTKIPEYVSFPMRGKLSKKSSFGFEGVFPCLKSNTNPFDTGTKFHIIQTIIITKRIISSAAKNFFNCASLPIYFCAKISKTNFQNQSNNFPKIRFRLCKKVPQVPEFRKHCHMFFAAAKSPAVISTPTKKATDASG